MLHFSGIPVNNNNNKQIRDCVTPTSSSAYVRNGCSLCPEQQRNNCRMFFFLKRKTRFFISFLSSSRTHSPPPPLKPCVSEHLEYIHKGVKKTYFFENVCKTWKSELFVGWWICPQKVCWFFTPYLILSRPRFFILSFKIWFV